MAARAFPLLLLCLAAGCADPPQPGSYYSPPADIRMSTATLSKQLAPGMTEAQVSELREPEKITLQTCGQTSGSGPWQCKVYHYGSLVVAFPATQSGWVVNSWS
jgi:hypothetical protein